MFQDSKCNLLGFLIIIKMLKPNFALYLGAPLMMTVLKQTPSAIKTL